MTKLATDFSGHGGGDVRMVLEFLEMITTGQGTAGYHLAGAVDQQPSGCVRCGRIQIKPWRAGGDRVNENIKE